MRENGTFLCSDLIVVSTERKSEVGNLEVINPTGCTLTMPHALRAGTPVRIQCLECPVCQEHCTECRFEGIVQQRAVKAPYGFSVEVQFAERTWSAKEWRPRHLFCLQPEPGSGHGKKSPSTGDIPIDPNIGECEKTLKRNLA